MVNLYNFFILVFTLQKNQKQQQQIFEKQQSLSTLSSRQETGESLPIMAKEIGHINHVIQEVGFTISSCVDTSVARFQELFKYPTHTPNTFLLFNPQPLLAHLSQKHNFLLFQCLDALKAIDIEQFKKMSFSACLHKYYMYAGHGISSLEDFKYFKSYFKQLNKSTLSQVITGAKKEYQDKIMALDFKRKLTEFEYKNTIQNFFHYIDNNYTPPVLSDYITSGAKSAEENINEATTQYEVEQHFAHSFPYCLAEIDNFFKQQDFQIKEVEDLNQSNLHSVNYFGSFLNKLLLSPVVSGEFLVRFLTAVYQDKNKAIDFLLSLSGSHIKTAIFKNVPAHSALLAHIFERFDPRQSSNIGIYHFSRNYNLVCTEQTPLDILYVFDNLSRLTQSAAYKKIDSLGVSPAVGSTDIGLQILKDLRHVSQLENKENEKYIEFENLVLIEKIEKNLPTNVPEYSKNYGAISKKSAKLIKI